MYRMRTGRCNSCSRSVILFKRLETGSNGNARFNIVNRDDLVDSDFGRWVTYKHPHKSRTRQPLLGGRSWPTQHDPWRGISKTAFGLDYLKLYKVVDPEHHVETDPVGKYMELNTWDASENPCYGLDVYGQRLVRTLFDFDDPGLTLAERLCSAQGAGAAETA